MSFNMIIACGMSGQKTITSGVDNYSTADLRVAVGGNRSFTSATTPDGENGAFPLMTLTAGAATIDLTALTDVNGASITLTGKKVRGFYFENLSTSNTMTFAKGASNGSTALSGSWTFTLWAGQRVCIDLGGVATASIADISASLKTIDVSGTGTDTFNFGVIVG